MKKLIFLSHPLNLETPSYGNRTAFKVEHSSKISCCNSSNSQHWELPNHIGTHVDVPYHFDEEGKKITDYFPEDWIFNTPFYFEIKCEKNYILKLRDIEPYIPENCDLILIKTGFEFLRNQDEYWSSNPGIEPEIGMWLRNQRKNVKAIGFDFISLTSYSNRELGKTAHKAFLHSSYPGMPIRIIEDMKLSDLNITPKKVIVAPLLVDGADGSPVTIFAEI